MKRHSSYILILIGLIFLLDFAKLGNFIILPDIVGYILILIGIKKLADANSNQSLKKITIILYCTIVLSLFDLPYLNSISVGSVVINTVASFILFIVNIVLVYLMLESIAAIYRDEGNETLFSSAHKTWRSFLYLQLFIFVVSIVNNIILNYIVLALMITSTIILIIYLLKCYKNDKQNIIQK